MQFRKLDSYNRQPGLPFTIFRICRLKMKQIKTVMKQKILNRKVNY